MHEDHLQRRFALYGVVLQHVDQHFQPLDRRDARGKLAAAASEEGDLVAGLHPQHVHRVMCAVFRQQDTRSGAQGGVEIEARHARIFA